MESTTMESITMEGAAVCMQDNLQAQAMEKLHRAYRDECQRQMRRSINTRWMRKHMGGAERYRLGVRMAECAELEGALYERDAITLFANVKLVGEPETASVDIRVDGPLSNRRHFHCRCSACGEELSLEPLPAEQFCLHGAAALEAYFEHPDTGEQVVLLW